MPQTKSGAGPGKVLVVWGRCGLKFFRWCPGMVPGMILGKIFKNWGKTDLHRH